MQNVGPVPDLLNQTHVLARSPGDAFHCRSRGWVPALECDSVEELLGIWQVVNKCGCLGPTPAELDGLGAGGWGLGVFKASQWILMGRKSENHQARRHLLPPEAF